jgi:hypothetical protein
MVSPAQGHAAADGYCGKNDDSEWSFWQSLALQYAPLHGIQSVQQQMWFVIASRPFGWLASQPLRINCGFAAAGAAIQSRCRRAMDCFVAALLAMTSDPG